MESNPVVDTNEFGLAPNVEYEIWRTRQWFLPKLDLYLRLKKVKDLEVPDLWHPFTTYSFLRGLDRGIIRSIKGDDKVFFALEQFLPSNKAMFEVISKVA